MNIHNLCFEQKCEKYQSFSSENFQFLEVKFSIYLKKRVFVMATHFLCHVLNGMSIFNRNIKIARTAVSN